MRIGIDLMGSDSPPNLLFSAVLQAAEKFGASTTLVVIATKTVVDQILPLAAAQQQVQRSTITFQIVADTIAMADEPLGAVRRKKGSSLVVGMRLLKKRQIDAFVSCGNTGALVASAALSLSRLPGVVRPPLLASLPTEKGAVSVLDVGGNVSCKAHHLVQFAYLGSAYHRAIKGISVPKVGLLNVGSESKKGTKEVRQAYELLKAHCQQLAASGNVQMDFVGNVEGRDVFKGAVDVLVTDGFTGNVLLKTAEGVASLIFGSLIDICQQEGVSVDKVMSGIKKQFDYAEYPGAIVCGVDGVVVKVHGCATAKALYSSIVGASQCVERQVISGIKQQLQIEKIEKTDIGANMDTKGRMKAEG